MSIALLLVLSLAFVLYMEQRCNSISMKRQEEEREKLQLNRQKLKKIKEGRAAFLYKLRLYNKK